MKRSADPLAQGAIVPAQQAEFTTQQRPLARRTGQRALALDGIRQALQVIGVQSGQLAGRNVARGQRGAGPVFFGAVPQAARITSEASRSFLKGMSVRQGKEGGKACQCSVRAMFSGNGGISASKRAPSSATKK